MASAILVGALLLWNASTFGYIVWVGTNPLPFGDQWDSTLFPEQCIRNLFVQHNEHRPALGRLMGLLDWYLGDARNVINASFIVLCYPIFGLALLKTVNVIVADWRRAALVSALASAITLSAAQWENMVWGFQTTFVGSFVFAFLALVFAALAMRPQQPPRRKLVNVLLCLFASFVAVFSLASGLLVLLFVIALFFLLGTPARLKYGYVGFAVAVFAFYLYGLWRPTEHANPLTSLLDLWTVGRFALIYIGSPFARGDVDVATAVGAFGALLLIALVADASITFRSAPQLLHSSKGAAYVALLLFAAFIICAGALTALGRMNFGIRQALADRYATPALLFWGDLIATCLVQRYVCRYACSRIFPWLGAATGIVLASYVAAHQISYIPVARILRAERFDAAVAYLVGIRNQPVVLGLYPVPAFLIRGGLDEAFQRLQRSRKSVFTNDWATRLGTPLREWKPVLGSACRGAVDQRAMVPDQEVPISELEGWAWDDERGRVPDLIVFTDAQGLVVGFAGSSYLRIDVRREQAGITSNYTGWKGFVRADRTATVHAYAISFGQSSRACEFAASFSSQ